MNRILFPCLLMLFALNGAAQVNKIDIPMQKGKVHYEKSYAVNKKLKQDELFGRALKWFKKGFPNTTKTKTTFNKKTGEITGTGIFKIVTSGTGNYYLVRFVIAIKVHDGGYTFSAYDFYEKPIENGISNEYSKIEYRWWDFRQGKPWSAEDETLFKGIAEDETTLMHSFEVQIQQ